MRAFAHADAGSRQVTHHSPGLRDQHGLGARHVAFDGATNDHARARNRSNDHRAWTESQVTRYANVSFDAAQYLKRAVASNVAANDRGAAYH